MSATPKVIPCKQYQWQQWSQDFGDIRGYWPDAGAQAKEDGVAPTFTVTPFAPIADESAADREHRMYLWRKASEKLEKAEERYKEQAARLTAYLTQFLSPACAMRC